MESLWLVSHDLKRMTCNLTRSRNHMHQAQRSNKIVMRNLEKTIDDLKQQPPKPFRVKTDDEDDE